jgi:uncharacterized protein (TIGR02266 family)
MKTILDLLREFGTLNEAKVKGGKLSPESESRWSELKDFYNRLMANNGISKGRVTQRFGLSELRESLQRRQHLRVPMMMEIMFEHECEFQYGRVTNLSCGGVFLVSDTVLEVEAKLSLYLANVGRGPDAVMPVEGAVAWTRKEEQNHAPKGMGIRFVNLPDSIYRQLDRFVLETLEKHLCSLNLSVLDPEFLDRENIKL